MIGTQLYKAHPNWFKGCCRKDVLYAMNRWKPGKVQASVVTRIGARIDKKNKLAPGTGARVIKNILARNNYGRLQSNTRRRKAHSR